MRFAASWLAARAKILATTDGATRFIPGHGPLAARDDLQKHDDMLAAAPARDLAARYGHGFLAPDQWVQRVYVDLKPALGREGEAAVIGRRRRVWLGMIASIAAVCLQSRPLAADELVRVSTSFEAENVAQVLKRVARVFAGGFGRAEAERVAAGIDKLKSEQEGSWEFTATFNRRPVVLRVRAVMDDMAMVDLDFLTDAAAAQRIRREIDAFTSEHGL
jgi:hypothetical protein